MAARSDLLARHRHWCCLRIVALDWCCLRIVALALLRLIGLFTNLFYFGRWSSEMVSPTGNHLGVYAIFVPVVGALIIGVMARFGSERIRGHGIPEAIESILLRGSKIEPRVALLKPISSAISIGSGGPFGAEGPIIMTGGAVPSGIRAALSGSGPSSFHWAQGFAGVRPGRSFGWRPLGPVNHVGVRR